MPKDVKFNIRLNIDGRSQIVRASASLDELSRNIARVGKVTREAGRTMEVWTQAGVATRNLSQGLADLSGVVGQCVGAYNTQIEAETKLATVMRQRMAASDEDIQAIKDLASAQQQLGVIGDEVQLAGTQQVATFLTQRGSIETLLPAMNNLLAQQRGLNATSGDAVAIANLVGKAMQGQTSALRRVGITFSEAQAEAMKYGDESSRAAMLAEIITQNVGEMNRRLADTDAGRAKQLANNMGDLVEAVGSYLTKAQPAFVAITGTVSAFNAVSQVAASSGAAIKSFSALLSGSLAPACRAARSAHVYVTASVNALTTALRGGAVGATTMRVAMRGLMVASGVGLAIAAVTGAVMLFTRKTDAARASAEGLRRAQEALRSSEDAYTEAVARAKAGMDGEIKKLAGLIKSKRDASGAVAELNRKYGDTFGLHRTASEWYATLIARSRGYCMQLGYEAQARAIAASAAEAEIRLQMNYDKRRDLWKAGKAQKTEQQAAVDVRTDKVYTWTRKVDTKEYKALKDEGRTLIAERNALSEKLAAVQKKMSAALATPKAAPAAPQPTATAAAPRASREKAPGDPMAAFRAGYKESAQTLGEIQENIRLLTALLSGCNAEQAAPINRNIAAWERLAEAIRKTGRDAELNGIADRASEMAAVADSTRDLARITDTAGTAFDTLAQKAKTRMAEIAAAIQKTSGKPAALEKRSMDAADAIERMGASISGLGGTLETPALDVAGTIAQAIANVVMGYSEASKMAASMGPWMWVAFAAAGLAQLTAVIGSIKQATAFAEGGVVSGPTYALVGEYAGAGNNPEVIAPLDRLRKLLRPEGGGGAASVDFRVRGRDLVGVLANETRVAAKSGSRTNIRI